MPVLHRSLLVLALSIPLAAVAQQPATSAPTYDVVSIHENKSASNNISIRSRGDAYVATNITLTFLVRSAYNIREELISGLPGWADSTHFDINAKISDPDPDALKKLSREQRQAMMLALLTDRFHLKAHIVTKTLPVYDLVIAKGGPKLKENTSVSSEPSDPGKTPQNLKPGTFRISDSQITAIAVPLSTLTPNLASIVERNIIDKTGLTGRYDIDLKWTPPEREGKPDGLTDNPPPDLFTALQEQLGLKLESSKGPVDTLVVDHVELPSEN